MGVGRFGGLFRRQHQRIFPGIDKVESSRSGLGRHETETGHFVDCFDGRGVSGQVALFHESNTDGYGGARQEVPQGLQFHGGVDLARGQMDPCDGPQLHAVDEKILMIRGKDRRPHFNGRIEFKGCHVFQVCHMPRAAGLAKNPMASFPCFSSGMCIGFSDAVNGGI